MPFSSYADNKLIDHLLGSGTFTKPSATYVALYVGDPTGAGTEVSTSGTAYSRQSAAFTISGNQASNTSTLEWLPATAPWGTITHIAIYDASTSGNMLVTASLTVAKTVGTDDVLRLPATDLAVTLT
jgi:hypothetical protein